MYLLIQWLKARLYFELVFGKGRFNNIVVVIFVLLNCTQFGNELIACFAVYFQWVSVHIVCTVAGCLLRWLIDCINNLNKTQCLMVSNPFVVLTDTLLTQELGTLLTVTIHIRTATIITGDISITRPYLLQIRVPHFFEAVNGER